MGSVHSLGFPTRAEPERLTFRLDHTARDLHQH